MKKNIFWILIFLGSVLLNKSFKDGLLPAICLSVGFSSILSMALGFLLMPNGLVWVANSILPYSIAGFVYQKI